MSSNQAGIDENTCRSDLTSSQRSIYTKRRKAIWEAMHPAPTEKFESVWDALGIVEGPMTEEEEREKIQAGEVFPPAIGYGKPPQQTKSSAAETAASTGMTKPAIYRHIARADALSDDIDRTVGTSPDNDVGLDKVAR